MDAYVHVLYEQWYIWYYSMPVSHHVGQNSGLWKCQEFGNAAAILLIFFKNWDSFKIIVVFFRNVMYLVFLMAELANRFQGYVAVPCC